MSTFPASPTPAQLERWAQIWQDPRPRIERHRCPSCGERFEWHVTPGPFLALPESLPVVDALHPVECVACMIRPRVDRTARRPASEDC